VAGWGSGPVPYQPSGLEKTLPAEPVDREGDDPDVEHEGYYPMEQRDLAHLGGGGGDREIITQQQPQKLVDLTKNVFVLLFFKLKFICVCQCY
jgi:hypothetical protein